MGETAKYFWKKDSVGHFLSSADRFNLLLLEPGEIYFEDFSVYYYPGGDFNKDPSSIPLRQKGRLKICSKSLVFDPLDPVFPILKFLFKDITDIGKTTAALVQTEPSSEIIQLETKTCICMKEGNLSSPYVYIRHKKRYYFMLNFIEMNGVLPQIEQLRRAYTLNPNDSLLMISAIVQARQSQHKFNTSWIEDFYENIIHEETASKITPLVCNPGRLLLTSKRLYFQPFNNIEADPVLKIQLSHIKTLVKRRYLLRHVGIELFLGDNASDIYFVFTDQLQRDTMFKYIMEQDELHVSSDDQENMTIRWQSGALSNFDYLMYLNSKADRSYNDLTQYPVFPWVIQDYTSTTLDLENPKTFRDLSKPVGALDSQRLKQLKDRCDGMPEPKFLYGSHYSSPGFVLYYLVRVAPDYMLCLQNGKFDKPDRLFNCIQSTWNNCCTGYSDFKELIPEFYDSDGSFLDNRQDLNLGIKQDSSRVNNVELPPWANGSAADFISKCRQALECRNVSKQLHNWIDLIFGYKQRGEEAWKADNVFYYLTYEGAIDLDNIENMHERKVYESQILEFGQTPKQLFTKPHPKRNDSKNTSKNTTSINTSIWLENTTGNVTSKTTLDIDEIDSNDVGKSDIPSKILSDKNVKLSLDPSLTPFHWLKNATLVNSVKLHKEAVHGCILTAQSENIFSVSQDTQLKVYSIENEQHLRCLNLSTMALSCCCSSDQEDFIFIGSWDNNIYTFSVAQSRIVDEKHAHDDAITCVRYKSNVLASSSWDSTVKVWSHDTSHKKSSLTLLGELEHDTEVTSCDFTCTSNNNLLLASATKDGIVMIWDVDSCMQLQQFAIHSESVSQVLLSEEGNRVFSCSFDKYMKVIDVNTEVELYSKDIGEVVNCAEWDGQLVVMGCASGEVLVWDLIKDSCMSRLQSSCSGSGGGVSCLAVSTVNETMVSGGDDGYIKIWKIL